jgi:hypothetical protein
MEQLWYYAVKGSDERNGPVPTQEIRDLLQTGRLQLDDRVWTEGMDEWQTVGSFPELCTPQIPAPAPTPLPGRAPLPEGLRGWMTFVSVMTIISGVISSLGCISIITGILMIIGGAALLGARNALDQIKGIEASLRPFFDKLRMFMQMSGLIYIVSLLIALVLFFVFFSVIMGAIAAAIHAGS